MRRSISAFLSAALIALPLAAHAQSIFPGQSPFSMSLPGAKKAGRFYGAPMTAGPTTNGLPAANRMFAQPVFIGASSVVKTMSFDISAGIAGAWNARMCIYADTGSGLPGSLVADSGTVAISSGSVTGVQTATLSGNGVTLGPGWYWDAFMADTSGQTLYSSGNATSGAFSTSVLLGGSSASNYFVSTTATNVYANQAFGACPSTFPAVTYGDSVAAPYVLLGF